MNPKVLVVDDDEDVLMVINLFLRSLDFEVETAVDGKEALHLLDMDDWDVILLDIRMPEMDGATFMRHYTGPVPIVVMSGSYDAALPREPFARVKKPMSMTDVAPILREAARSRHC